MCGKLSMVSQSEKGEGSTAPPPLATGLPFVMIAIYI